MTKYVDPFKYNQYEKIDEKTIANMKPERRYRIDRPKVVT